MRRERAGVTDHTGVYPGHGDDATLGGGAAHFHGLIDACGATASNGTLYIGAPWNELNECKHFGP